MAVDRSIEPCTMQMPGPSGGPETVDQITPSIEDSVIESVDPADAKHISRRVGRAVRSPG